MFGVDQPGGTLQGLATIPEFLWELSLGIYPIVRASRHQRRSCLAHTAATHSSRR